MREIRDELEMNHVDMFDSKTMNTLQWNLVIKRSDITKPSYYKVILLVPALYIS